MSANDLVMKTQDYAFALKCKVDAEAALALSRREEARQHLVSEGCERKLYDATIRYLEAKKDLRSCAEAWLAEESQKGEP